MNILANLSLADYSTMGLGGLAAHLVEIKTRDELAEALDWAKTRGLPYVMIGGGSNIIWSDEGYSGLVLVNKLQGFEIKDNGSVVIAAGEVWDEVVGRCVEAGLTGIEALSLIPGTTGGTPVQNAGAYGQEISETLVELEAYDTQAGKFVTIAGSDCGFSYRDSRFKTGPDRGRFFITQITLRLKKGNPESPFYASVQSYFDEHGINKPTPAGLREAVTVIRTAKLPNPAKVRNTGSFFSNPIIDESQFARLNDKFAGLPHWPAKKGVKLSAAWLISEAGFKDYHDSETGMATWPKQSLVLVNEKAKSTADLMKFKQKIVDAVDAKFGVTLVQEPELISS